ncbi:MAG: 50S ribosomal protein L32 [Deltaproteobacteria bacterium]|nr:50S ribosomal protein L32 [Deltaproteobacteria bacterium]
MPNPKKRHSRTRRDKRRSHDALSTPATSICPKCGEAKLPHNVCLKCGSYRGREILKIGESV